MFPENTNKKTVAVVAIVAVAVLVLVPAVFAAQRKIRQMGPSEVYGKAGAFGRMMGKGICAMPYPYEDPDKFVLPVDAAKSGEIAIIVGDLDGARESIAAAAAKNGGSVYATSIAYASDNIKNGSIVVQVPAANFDAAFADLKKVGSRIIQESSRQIPRSDIYPYPMPLGAEPAVSAEPAAVDAPADDAAQDGEPAKTDEVATSPDSAAGIAAMPIYYRQDAQDKGYVRVIFADYGISAYAGGATRPVGADMMWFGYAGQNMRDNLWVVLGVKSILLVTMIAVLAVVVKRILQDYRKTKSGKTASHVVKQMAKTRPRAVRFKNKKV